MNQNVIIGILVVIILAAGGFYFLSTNSSPAGTAATSTPVTGGTDTTGTPTDTTTSATAPSPITDATVAPTNSTAVVTGKITPNGGQTTYWYEYGVSENLGQETATENLGSGFSSITAPGYITGLKTNTKYYFRLSAQNSYGTVHGATYSFSTNNNPAGQGSAPAVNTNSANNVTRVSATLRADINAHSSQTTYWFEYGTNTGFGQVTSFQSGGNTNSSTAVSASVAGLDPQTIYYFRINAQNVYGTVNGTMQTFTTQGPAAAASPVVTTQVASPVTTTTATLRGTVNPYGTATTYWFEYSKDSQFNSGLKTTPQNSAGSVMATVSIAANVSGLNSGTTYYYRTVAQNATGIIRGNILTITTK